MRLQPVCIYLLLICRYRYKWAVFSFFLLYTMQDVSLILLSDPQMNVVRSSNINLQGKERTFGHLNKYVQPDLLCLSSEEQCRLTHLDVTRNSVHLFSFVTILITLMRNSFITPGFVSLFLYRHALYFSKSFPVVFSTWSFTCEKKSDVMETQTTELCLEVVKNEDGLKLTSSEICCRVAFLVGPHCSAIVTKSSEFKGEVTLMIWCASSVATVDELHMYLYRGTAPGYTWKVAPLDAGWSYMFNLWCEWTLERWDLLGNGPALHRTDQSFLPLKVTASFHQARAHRHHLPIKHH